MAGGARALSNGRVHVGLGEARLGVAVTAVADAVHPVVQDALDVRSVRVVAGDTVVGGGRGVLNLGLLRCLTGFRVTRLAERPGVGRQQFLVVGRVRTMTRQASLLAGDRRVLESDRGLLFRVAGDTQLAVLRLEQLRVLRCVRVVAQQALALLERQVLHLPVPLDVGGVMAVGAQLATLLGDLEGLRRGRRGVAGLALRAHDGRVHARLQQLVLHRAVRAVAADAGHLVGRVAAVRLAECRRVSGMAAEAERLLVLDQEVGLIRSVRRVTCGAAARLQHLVNGLLLVVRLVVALVAQLAGIHVEEVIGVRRVRVVADRALPGLERPCGRAPWSARACPWDGR